MAMRIKALFWRALPRLDDAQKDSPLAIPWKVRPRIEEKFNVSHP
jgi:hypothetical protein